jgi:hypothetical protein
MITTIYIFMYVILALFLSLPWFLADKPCPRCGKNDWDKEFFISFCRECGYTQHKRS